MKQLAPMQDIQLLSQLNARFIRNFITQDAASHDAILHKDFICIENSGAIVDRNEYLRDWTQAYDNSRYTSFSYSDEFIRIFGNTALVRSRTHYTKPVNGKMVSGQTVYTDTYVKENGRWLCVQAQITPVLS